MADEDETPENEATEGEEGEESEGGGKKSKKKLLIIIIAAVLLLGGGAGAFLMIGGGDEKAEEHSEETHDGEHAEGDHEGEEGEHSEDHAEGEKGTEDGKANVSNLPVYYELPDFIVNLNTGGRRTSFLKMKVVLELANQEVVLQMDAYKPRVLDAFNTYLRELRTSDLSGSAGIYRLRRELMLRIEKSVGTDVVTDILFKEIVVQ